MRMNFVVVCVYKICDSDIDDIMKDFNGLC